MSPIYTYTLSLPGGKELFEIDIVRSKWESTTENFVSLLLKRSLTRSITENEFFSWREKQIIPFLEIRQYDLAGVCVRKIRFENAFVSAIKNGPDLVFEFRYKKTE